MQAMSLLAMAINGFKPQPMELPAFITSAKNAVNQCHIDTGATIQMIEIISNITDTSLIEQVMVKLNGQAIVDLTGADLKDLLEAYTKRTRAAGRYVIPFYKPEARTIDGIRSGELVTLPSDNLTLFVKVGDTGATVPTLRARALVTPSQSQRVVIPRMDSIDITAAASGENVLNWNDRDANVQVQRLHFQAADITKLEVKRDELTVFEATLEDNNADLSEGGDNAPVANTYHFDPAHTGFVLQGLFATVARKSLKFRYTKTAAGNVRVVRELLEQVAALPQL